MKKNKGLIKNNDSQIIILMGIILAVSVFTISSFGSNLSNLDIVLISDRSESLLNEFTSVKESFVYSLNYDLADNIVYDDDGLIFYGNINNLPAVFETTKQKYYNLELKHDIIFDAKLNDYYILHPLGTDDLYQVEITLMIISKETTICEDVRYTIICKTPETLGAD